MRSVALRVSGTPISNQRRTVIFDTGTNKIIMPREDLDLLAFELKRYAPIEIHDRTIVCVCT